METPTNSTTHLNDFDIPASWGAVAQKFQTGPALFSLIVLYVSYKTISRQLKRAAVPGVGYSSIPLLSSWIAAYNLTRDPLKAVGEGIAKYKPGYFRISTIMDEYVLVTDRDKVAEYLKAPDDVLSMQEAANDQQQIPFTMGYGVGHRTYHTPVVRQNLTQSIKRDTATMYTQVNEALDELIGDAKDWTPVSIYPVIAMTVAQVSNRVMVSDEDLYKDRDYLTNAIRYAEAVVLTAEMIRAFPDWLKHILIRFSPVWSRRRVAIRYLGQIIRNRMEGNFREGKKPEDLLQWLIDAAPPVEKTVSQLVERHMAMNVASIHTTTMTFTGALYKLAAEPDKYVEELRAELLEHLESGQLTKETVPKLKKMDSFLRESARFNNTGLLSVQRNAKAEFVFSDGTVIPKGCKIGAPSRFVHRDPLCYENPDTFDGFRFSRMREAEGSATKYQMVSTDPELHLFGHGKHACPGRFFATNEMKLMFASLLLRYDMKLESGTYPKESFIATMCIPETKLPILMKGRALQRGPG